MRALDLCCGTGKWTPFFARSLTDNGRVVAYDYSPAMLDQTRLRLEEEDATLLEKTLFVRGDAYYLPFASQTFDLVFFGFWLSHVPHERVEPFFEEIKRVLKPGGTLEVWVPDGLKIARAFVAAEQNGRQDYALDGWWRFNEERDPCVWMAGRCFSYGDGTGRPKDPNWHRAIFSERYLARLFRETGLVEIQPAPGAPKEAWRLSATAALTQQAVPLLVGRTTPSPSRG